MNGILLDESEAYSYVGKIIKELEEGGYEKSGFINSENDIRELVISSIEITGLPSYYYD